MIGWHHQLSGYEFEQTLAHSEGQGSLACYNPLGHQELDMSELLNNNNIFIWFITNRYWLSDFPGGSVIKNMPANARDIRDVDSVPGLGRSPEGGHGNPFQYSCLQNPHGHRSLVGYSL